MNSSSHDTMADGFAGSQLAVQVINLLTLVLLAFFYVVGKRQKIMDILRGRDRTEEIATRVSNHVTVRIEPHMKRVESKLEQLTPSSSLRDSPVSVVSTVDEL